MNETRTLKLGPQARTFAIERAAVNQQERTVPLCFSSETPIERWWGIEILDHSPGAVRLDRLKSNAAVLCDHDWCCQVGVVENPTIDADRKGRAVARFSSANPRAVQEYQDILDGIRANISVGYIIHAMQLESETEGTPTYRITDWEPYEISTVSVPADFQGSGIGRDLPTGKDGENIRDITITIAICNEPGESEGPEDPEPPEPPETETAAACDPAATDKESRTMEINVETIKNETRTAELSRVREIRAIAEKHPNLRDLADKHITDGTPLDEFRTIALAEFKATPVRTSAEIGMSARDLSAYSIVRAMNQIAETGKLDGIEREASEATAKLIKRDASGFFIPQDLMKQQRTLISGDSTKGGYAVQTDTLTGDLIELLRNKTLCSRMGARTMTGLVGNIAIPAVTGGATAYWLSETGTVTASDQAFGQIGLVPHRLVGDTAFSKQLLAQTSLDVESFVREDLMRVLAIEKDRAAINGGLASGEPVGILNAGVGSLTFGGAATWAKVLEFESTVATANADFGALGYLTTPVTRAKWKAAVKVTNQAVFLWGEGDGEFGMVNGYRAGATNQIPTNRVIFGNWNDLIFAEWAGIDVVVDPYSLKKAGQVEVTITLLCDIGIRHSGSFCASTDTGAA